MADNVTLPGAGVIVGARSRTVNSISGVEAQLTEELGSAVVYTTQVNVTNSAATLIAAHSDRLRVRITNRQSEPIFVGPATVTTANGYQIDPGDDKVFQTTALLQAITAAASGASEKTHILEEADL